MTATTSPAASAGTSRHRPDGSHPPAATSIAIPPATPKVRDGFLDTVRAIALIRVIIWHTLAAALVSWIVASMPAMFFVAGSLLARSLDNQPLRKLFTTRLRRLLLPFWAFGAVVLSVLVLVHHLDPTAATALARKSCWRGSFRSSTRTATPGKVAGRPPRCGTCAATCGCCCCHR